MQKVPLFGVFSVYAGTNEAISTLIWSCRISSKLSCQYNIRQV